VNCLTSTGYYQQCEDFYRLNPTKEVITEKIIAANCIGKRGFGGGESLPSSDPPQESRDVQKNRSERFNEARI